MYETFVRSGYPDLVFTLCSYYNRPHLEEQIFRLLKAQYWGRELTLSQVKTAFQHSSFILLFADPIPVTGSAAMLIGCARAVTDLATFAFVCDVAVSEEFRDQGFGRMLVEALLRYPGLATVTRVHLMSRDSDFWSKFGFTPLTKPTKHFELLREAKERSVDENQAERGASKDTRS